MKFDVSNFHTIFEASKEPTTDPKVQDQTGANLDNTLSSSDLISIFDDICPITGSVYAAMKNAASDPKNLKITLVKSGDGEDKVFVEATEFATFLEATSFNPGEAVEEIIEAYEEDTPQLANAEFHVVFPSDSLNQNTLGGERLGADTKNDWAMQLMRGCRRYGIISNAGVEEAPSVMSESSILLEAKFSILPRLRRDPAMKQYEGDLKEAQQLCNLEGIETKAQGVRFLRVGLKLLNICSNIASIAAPIGAVGAAIALAANPYIGGTALVRFGLITVAGYLLERGFEWCYANGEETFASQEASKAIAALDKAIAKAKDEESKKKLQACRDKITAHMKNETRAYK